MNRRRIGDKSAKYDCSAIEKNKMTPTMVSNFDFPNTYIDKNGPYLEILEQPQTKFRFRYKSEMVGTHGQLKAESSDKNRLVYPTVKLLNWNEGSSVVIRLTLYTAEDNVNERVRHVHELNGKNCNKEGFVGESEVIVDRDNSYTAQFSNLGIIHIAKRDVQNIIFERKKEEFINQSFSVKSNLETVQHKIDPVKLQELKDESEEEGRKMDLNKVVLRFQAFVCDSKNSTYRPITNFVDSDVILNLKNASTGELKIVRISTVSCSCTGGAEVWMLVEKVKKNNVKIKFYETDDNNQEIWSDYGSFKESDVHHQYAIVFRTPPYRLTNIREPVHVKVQLVRHPDNDLSESIDFTYLPESLKRPGYTSTNDSSLQKRPRYSNVEAIDLKTKVNLFLGTGEIKQPYSPETPNQSPSHMVPSPMTPADSPTSHSLYSPPHQVSSNQPTIVVSGASEDPFLLDYNNEMMNIDFNNQGFLLDQMNDCEETNHTQQGIMYNGIVMPANRISAQMDTHPSYYNHYSNVTSTLSPRHQVPSPSSVGHGSPLGVSPGSNSSPTFMDQGVMIDDADNAFTQIQQFDAVHKQVIHSKSQIANNMQWDFSDWVNNTRGQMQRDEDVDLLDIINNPKMFAAPRDFGDIQADCAKGNRRNTGHKSKIKDEVSEDVEDLTLKLSKVSVLEQDPGIMDGDDDNLKLALSTADCLQSYASTGDIRLLLASHRLLLTAPNRYGDNALHSAVLSGNIGHFKKILKAINGLSCDINKQNSDGQTPLHLTAQIGNYEMAKSLLLTPGCNIGIKDLYGNTALHLAAKKAATIIINAILTQSFNGKRNSSINVINQFNFQGQTALHLAVMYGGLEDVKIFLKKGANAHLCEKTRGSNPLHLAVINTKRDVVKYLLENTDITVNAAMFNGNTALHISAQNKDSDICSLLVQAKANPSIMNNLSKEGEEDEANNKEGNNIEKREEKIIGCTSFDYADDNEEILKILQSASVF